MMKKVLAVLMASAMTLGLVACGSGAVELVSVQLEGKKQMSAEEFFRGQRTKVGDMIVSYE